MKKITLLFITMLSISITAKAQNFVWAKSVGSTGYDFATAISTTTNGDVVVGGAFNNTVDFDPGVGVTSLTSAGSYDIFIAKYTSAGNFVWAKRIGNTSQNEIFDLKTDINGNVYITGGYSGTIDFDPGAGTSNLTSVGLSDVFVCKYDVNGNYLWAKSMGGTGTDWAQSIDIDNAGGVYTTGLFSGGAADFNPAAGTATVLTYGGRDIFISKLDASGNYVWAKGMGGTANDDGKSIKVANGIVYTTGTFSLTASLSGNVGVTATFTAVGTNDVFVSKLDAATGLYVRTRTFGGPAAENATSITVDASDNVYLTGNFNGTCDFDPSAGIQNIGAIGSNGDGFVCKFDANILFVWAKQFSSLDEVTGQGIILDSYNNIITTGRFFGTADFDPSPSSYTVTDVGNSNYDAYVHKLDPNGNFLWVRSWGNTNSVSANSLALDAFNNIYTCGDFFTTCDFDPSSSASYSLTSNGFTDAVIHKLSCTLPTTVTINSNLIPVCVGSVSSKTLAISSIPEVGVTYSWSAIGASGIVFSPTTGTNTSISYTASSSFSVIVTATNSCGTTTTMVQSITPYVLPTLTAIASPSTICYGDPATFTASGASTYTWNPSYILNGMPTVHFAGGVFTVTGTDANNCVNTKTVSFTVNSNPTITVTGKTLVCLNKPTVLTSVGANTYTWMPSSTVNATITAQPTVSTVYTVTGKDINGCMGTKTFSLNLVTPQTPSICVVSVDSISSYNYVIWDKTVYTNVDSFIVYREVSTNVYKRIGAQHKTASSRFRDTARSVGPANGNPNITSYRYKLQLLDSCGNYSAYSPYHNSLYFSSNTTGGYSWNSYDVEGQPITPVTTFDLFRDNFGTNVWVPIGSCAGTQLTLNDPAYATYPNAIWRVDANGFNCNATFKLSPSQQVNKSKSNIKNNLNAPVEITGITSIEINKNVNIAPNPAIDELIVSFNDDVTKNTTLVVTDVLGKVITTVASVNEKSVIIPISGMTSGIYFITIQQGNAKAVKKFVKE